MALVDLGSKVAFLTHYIDTVATVAQAIPNDHLARIYGRSLFLGVDSLTKLAPALKNDLRRAGSLSKADADALKAAICRLTDDYESYYATVRDKLSAHQQEIDLGRLLECWNEIDEPTLVLLRDDALEIWRRLEHGGAQTSFARPSELDDPATRDSYSALVSPAQGVRVAADRVGATRPNTISMIPSRGQQEKTSRILTAFECFRLLIDSGLERITAQWFLPEKACIDLLVVDACSVFDNIFGPPAPSNHTDQTLLEHWEENDVKGRNILASFPRDVTIETQTRDLRNRFAAHMDQRSTLDELVELLLAFDLNGFHAYVARLWMCMQTALGQDIRNLPFLSHNRELVGVVEAVRTDAVKPFRA